ncbi:MAG: sulfotransferase [Cryomorphaceae bacterium]|nr:sulfotransferase [Cryomorphaceae bacterium]
MLPAFSAPFIVIGCHRSGTSWLTKAMHDAGINMGVSRDKNQEAWHFLSLNQQALQAAGGAWDNPVVPEERHWPPHDKRSLLKSHFGVTQRRELLTLWLRRQKWGWKDPRNTFTLDHWLKMFPDGKVIYLRRGAEEVVRSLMERQQQPGEVQSEILVDEAAAHQLWRKYKEQAEKQLRGNSRIVLDYEKLLNADVSQISLLNHFCQTDVGAALIKTRNR